MISSGVPMTKAELPSGEHAVDGGATAAPKGGADDAQTMAAFKKGSEMLFADFLETTTLHGIKYVFNKNHGCFRRLLWLLLVLTCDGLLLYSASLHIKDYLSHGTVEDFNTVHKSSILFPAVTICNYNVIKRSSLASSVVEKLQSAAISTSDGNFVFRWEELQLENEFENINMTEFLLTHAHQISDMIVECRWGGRRNACGPENFTRVLTNLGVCYTFNDGPFDAHSKADVNDADSDFESLTVGSMGAKAALWLRLTAEVNENLNTVWDDGVGFKVLIHQQGDVPLVGDIGLAIMPGVRTVIAMSKKIAYNMPPPYNTNCRTQHLDYFPFYSEKACLMECEIAEVHGLCGCKFPYMAGPLPTCSLKEYVDCVKRMSSVDTTHNPCQCPRACREEFFTTTTSYLKAPGETSTQRLQEQFNWTREDVEQNIAEVEIFYETMNELQVTAKDAYRLVDMASDIGGEFGLFIGASLLTIFEFIDFSIVRDMYQFRYVPFFWRRLKRLLSGNVRDKDLAIRDVKK
ncbi:acid-sensing ion channel 2-like [Diadema antillarum]|uniref:acid-sensing ion channel 2-like n=1 Tax=Diadema antillarum TaxID=105358 RepID=UPI003A85692A